MQHGSFLHLHIVCNRWTNQTADMQHTHVQLALCLPQVDQPDGWYAAASLIGSIASLGVPQARAIGGGGLVKPILWVLKSELPECQGAAMRALSHLAREPQACATLAQVGQTTSQGSS